MLAVNSCKLEGVIVFAEVILEVSKLNSCEINPIYKYS